MPKCKPHVICDGLSHGPMLQCHAGMLKNCMTVASEGLVPGFSLKSHLAKSAALVLLIQLFPSGSAKASDHQGRLLFLMEWVDGTPQTHEFRASLSLVRSHLCTNICRTIPTRRVLCTPA